MNVAALQSDHSIFDRRQPIDYPANHNSKPFHVQHSSPSLLHPKHDAEPTEMRLGTVLHKSVDATDRIPSKLDARKAIKDAVFRALPAYRITAAEVANRIGVSVATVEGWRTKDGVPSAECLTLLRLAYPEFEAALNCALGLSDLELQQEIVMIQLRQQLRGGR